MKMLGLMRVKNEDRWLEASLRSQWFCDHILVLDDNSTDKTAEVCDKFDFVTRIPKAYQKEHDEKADREFLAQEAAKYSPEWICGLAGDEVLLDDTWGRIEPLLSDANVIEVLNLHLWDDGVRIDGHWKEQYRQSFWRFKSGALTYQPDHCSIPDQITERPFTRAGVRMLHYANITEQDRRRHYDLYMSHGIHCPQLIETDVQLVSIGEAMRIVV